MFETIIVEPILNIVTFIYAIVPGHNYGVAVILFTVLVRFVMNPLIRKHLRSSRVMREIQPEITKIKKATKGDPQETSRLTMELYKERQVGPFSSLGVVGVQVLILIGFYTGLRHVADDPTVIVTTAYDWIQNLGVIKELAVDINNLDFTLFGAVDLSRSAGGSEGFYLPAFVLVIGSVVSQYYMGKQTLPEDKDARSVKNILSDTKSGGKKLEAAEFQSHFGKVLKFVIPLLIFSITYSAASAVALFWFASGVIGYYQQRRILQQDEQEIEQIPGISKKKKRLKSD